MRRRLSRAAASSSLGVGQLCLELMSLGGGGAELTGKFGVVLLDLTEPPGQLDGPGR